jgi:hypothetical protein
MTKLVTATLISALALASLVEAAPTGEVTVESMPPSVVKTVPACGDTAVPATTKEIRVTFSKDMMTKQMWSWSRHTLDSFPQISDKDGVKYLKDKRTCVLPVTLQPNKSYAIWVNSQNSNAFRDTAGHPAVPYLLVFKTK